MSKEAHHFEPKRAMNREEFKNLATDLVKAYDTCYEKKWTWYLTKTSEWMTIHDQGNEGAKNLVTRIEAMTTAEGRGVAVDPRVASQVAQATFQGILDDAYDHFSNVVSNGIKKCYEEGWESFTSLGPVMNRYISLMEADVEGGLDYQCELTERIDGLESQITLLERNIEGLQSKVDLKQAEKESHEAIQSDYRRLQAEFKIEEEKYRRLRATCFDLEKKLDVIEGIAERSTDVSAIQASVRSLIDAHTRTLAIHTQRQAEMAAAKQKASRGGLSMRRTSKG